MPFVNRFGSDDEEESADVAAGAPPGFDVDFDPHDPEQVKVHYDLGAWTDDQRAELAETFAERGVPHAWDGDEVVVPEEIEAAVDEIFAELEAELGPFPVVLDADAPGTEFGLDEWPEADLDTLRTALREGEIPHRWSGRTLFVAEDAEDTVDELLDAIEAGEVASIDEGEGEAPDGALGDLFASADRLARDGTHAQARERLLELAPQLSPSSPPFGIAARSWTVIVERVGDLVGAFEDGSPTDGIEAAAAELRSVCRPFV